MSGELATTGGGTPAQQLEAGTITTQDVRRYYEAVKEQIAGLVRRLDGISEEDTACIQQYRQVATAAKAIADQFESTIAAMRAERLDERVIAEAIRQREAIATIARIATAAADHIEAEVRAARARIREQAQTAGAAANSLLELMDGYRSAEQAVQGASVQMPHRTSVLGAR